MVYNCNHPSIYQKSKTKQLLVMNEYNRPAIETTQVKLCDKVNIDYATTFFISLNHHIYELIKGL
jgi:hypothetical protein